MDSGQKQRVGVIGGGQLAWMMALEAPGLGIELVVQTPYLTDPAVSKASQVIFAPIDDPDATARLAQVCEVITFENEFIDLESLLSLAKMGVCFRPRLEALKPLLDKYEQRCYLRQLGIPVPNFARLDWDNLPESLMFPLVLKRRRQGYDGQGTLVINRLEELGAAREKWDHTPVLQEAFVPFERELAVMAARFASGEVVVYPVVETQQIDRVCRWVLIPAQVSDRVRREVVAIAHTLLNQLEVVGIFGIELFLTSSDQVLVNEIAPRTHNSGHFSLEGCQTSQFAQHLRAVANLPPGDSRLSCPGAVMVNLLGYESSRSDYLCQRQQLAEMSGSHVHWYGKSEAKPGRKLGHVTVCTNTQEREELKAIAQTVESIWYPALAKNSNFRYYNR